MNAIARPLMDRLGITLAGVLGIALLAAVAGYAQAGPLDPPAGASPSSTDAVRLPGTAISAPMTINASGHYYLTRNLHVDNGTAITVNAVDVSIDLGGFALSGNDAPLGRGIDVTPGGSARFSVRNGTIADFGLGILAPSSDNRVEDVMLISNNNGLTVGTGGVVSGCLVSGNVIGILITGNFVEVRDCNISDNSENGVMISNGIFSGLIEETAFFANNTLAVGSGNGIQVDGARVTVRDSEFSINAVRDMFLAGSESIVFDNVLNCPTSVGTGVGTTNFVPVNSADPHTNRAQKAVC